jgi:predicted lipoprotein with Yx(FWY)xxD motif
MRTRSGPDGWSRLCRSACRGHADVPAPPAELLRRSRPAAADLRCRPPRPASLSAAGSPGLAGAGGAAVLTNANGFTLCSFAPDTPATSKCPGSCAAYWPPVTPVPPRPARPAGPGRRDHPDRWLPPAHLQRHPLYTYIGDTAPGQAKGNNLNLNGGLSPGRGYARPGRPVIGRLAP